MEIERKKKDQREQMMDGHQDKVEPEGMKSQNQNLISENKTLWEQNVLLQKQLKEMKQNSISSKPNILN